MYETARHFIGGDWVSNAADGTMDVIDPATGAKIGAAALGSSDLTNQAVSAARAAFVGSDWPTEPRLRSRVLDAFADRLESLGDDFVELLVRENGKLRSQAAHEIAAGVSEARYYSGLARNILGSTTETGNGKLSLLTREPCGVVAVIVPWNAPVTLLVRSVAPALAAGCTVVIKPAPQTPLVSTALMACFHGINGLPPGVVNMVNENGDEVGKLLSSHADIDAISFTGSTQTGKNVMASAAGTIKRVSLELGGKAPAIVFPDSNLSMAVAEISRSSIVMAGQMCTAISRVLVHESVAPQVEEMIENAYGRIRLGHGLKQETDLGPLIDKRSQKRVLDLIERAGDEAELVVRGNAPGGELSAGAFVSPTIVRISDTGHDLVQQEHFAPLITFETFCNEAEALAKSNATRYGLAASVYTQGLDRAMRMSRQLKYGTVWLNCHNRLFAEAETGGFRESGVGRLHGAQGLDEFLETKHIYLESESVPSF
jgi:betaine-aldehyde dehydrogenase